LAHHLEDLLDQPQIDVVGIVGLVSSSATRDDVNEESRRIRRVFVVLLAALAIVLPMASPAGAVTNGSPNNGARPYVGLSVYYDADWNPMWRCSGAMISETVYLTATHE
jgi:hypothetical protein